MVGSALEAGEGRFGRVRRLVNLGLAAAQPHPAESAEGAGMMAGAGIGGGLMFMIGVPLAYGVGSFICGLIYGLVINLVFGLGREPQATLDPWLYLALEMSVLCLGVYLPGHLILRRLFRRQRFQVKE